jgi:low temperature requirement protein LtrA
MTGNPLRHAVARMGGRDPYEENRASTPLELFFDLTFAIAFGVAAGLFAQSLAAGHVATGLLSFCFAMFAVIWAWINFSWFASAYDTDDWVFRLVTMVQMIGVLILAMGIEPMFVSIQAGVHVDNRVMVLGYVVMRVALLFQWLRAAKQDPLRRATCLRYAKYLAVAQLGWIVVIVVNTSVGVMFLMAAPLFLLEMATPRHRRTQGADSVARPPHRRAVQPAGHYCLG